MFSPFGAISVLPFPTIFQGHWKLRFVEINRKTQGAEKQVLFPLVSQRLTFEDKNGEKRSTHGRSPLFGTRLLDAVNPGPAPSAGYIVRKQPKRACGVSAFGLGTHPTSRYGFAPNLRRNVIIGHQLVKAD